MFGLSVGYDFFCLNATLKVPNLPMDEFDHKSHARVIGNVLVAMGVLATFIATIGYIPDEIIALPPHFFGNGGVAAIGGFLLLSGFLARK